MAELGADTLDGTGGDDWADYLGSAAAVTVNLATGGSGGEAQGDSYISIEHVRGSDFNDQLTGNAGNNVLLGGLGKDTLDGGAGVDWAYYTNATGGVNVNLATGGTGGEANGDKYVSIENVRGSNFADSMTGDGQQNTLRGGLGNDALDGGLGNDILVFDTALGSTNVDTIVDFAVGGDKIHLENSIFTALGAPGALSLDMFAIGPAATESNDRIIYNDQSGALFYDADGLGGLSQIQFAALAPHLSLGQNDFVIM